MIVETHPFKPGDKLCNAFTEWDCLVVPENKQLTINIVQGYPKIYVKEPVVNRRALFWNNFKIFIMIAAFLGILMAYFYYIGLRRQENMKHVHDL